MCRLYNESEAERCSPLTSGSLCSLRFTAQQTLSTEQASEDMSYLSGIAVAQRKLVKAREEGGSHGQDLGVELRGPGHGRGPREKDHSLCCLRTQSTTLITAPRWRSGCRNKKRNPCFICISNTGTLGPREALSEFPLKGPGLNFVPRTSFCLLIVPVCWVRLSKST